MPNLVKLRREHARLIDVVQRLARFVMQPRPPEADELFKVRNELTSTLIGHLKTEDWVLYPRLLANPDPTVAGSHLRSATKWAASRMPTEPTSTSGRLYRLRSIGAPIARKPEPLSRR